MVAAGVAGVLAHGDVDRLPVGASHHATVCRGSLHGLSQRPQGGGLARPRRAR